MLRFRAGIYLVAKSPLHGPRFGIYHELRRTVVREGPSAPLTSIRAMADTDRLVWVDLEMTGLDAGRNVIVEIACLVTDGTLNPLDGGVSFVVAADEDQLAAMDPFVVDMHTKSGLLPEIPGGLPLAVAEQYVLDYVRAHVTEPRKAPLAGSSVHVDRSFLSVHMPELNNFLHYRIVDVSSIKELTRRWYPDVYANAPAKLGNHRALADIADSIKELAFYRDRVFVPAGMPDPAVAVEAAAE